LQGGDAAAVGMPIPVKGTELMDDYGGGHKRFWEKDLPKD